MRRFTRLVVGSLLGLILPRNDGGTAQADADAIAARALEEANARIRELEGLNEEKIRAAADERIHEIFPAITVPEDDSRRPVRPDLDGGGPPEPPSLEAQVAHLDRRLNEQEIDRAAEQLQGEIDRLMTKYPDADKTRVLSWIANAGDRPINLEKMVEISHQHEHSAFEERYARRRAEETAATRAAVPPPIPNNPGGQPVVGEPITTKTSASRLVQLMKEKLGWGG